MYNDPAGGNSQIVYFAVPVQIGTAYRVALDVYVPGAIRDGFYVFMLQSNAQTRVARWIFNNGVAPDLTADSNTMLASNIGLAAGWTHLEFTYTVPNPTQWASFAMLNNTCPQASPCAVMHFDAIEMQPQLGSGHIRAASITADRLVANTITAAQIAGGTITGANIAGGTITGGNIAARTIISGNIVSGTLGANEIAAGSLTADRLVARTITSGYIATGTITANELAATSITADKLNVSSLSAISANLGTVNAGTINGVTINGVTISGSTIYAGGANDVTLNGSGITINSGTGTAQALKWNNGASISSGGGGGMSLQTQGALYLYAGCTFVANSTYFVVQNCSTSLGSNNYPWTGLFIIPPTNNAAGGGSSFYPLQLNINDNQVHRKTNGYDGQCVITAGKSLYIDHGIVVGCV
jgi:hypothetical protein